MSTPALVAGGGNSIGISASESAAAAVAAALAATADPVRRMKKRKRDAKRNGQVHLSHLLQLHRDCEDIGVDIKRRHALGHARCCYLNVQNLGALSPPPPPYAPPMMFTLPPQQSWLAQPGSGLPEGLRSQPAHARIGRGGRLLIDRVHPLTYDPLNGVAHPESGVSLCNTSPLYMCLPLAVF